MPDYGYDMAGSLDITPALHDVGSDNIMPQVCVRRLTTSAGSLLSAPEEDTIDLRDYLSSGLTENDLYAIRSDMNIALTADERIDTVDITLQFDRVTEVMTTSVKGNGALGPFELTLSVSSVSVDIINQDS